MTQRTIRDRADAAVFVSDRIRHRCVRCGLVPPAPELFICASCREDPAAMLEVRNIEESFTDYREQRKALMLFGWAGGWWRQ
jgi:hypothetical protein